MCFSVPGIWSLFEHEEHDAVFGRNQTVSSHPFAAFTQDTKTPSRDNLYQQIFVFLVALCETI
jgi:hypothetical protein